MKARMPTTTDTATTAAIRTATGRRAGARATFMAARVASRPTGPAQGMKKRPGAGGRVGGAGARTGWWCGSPLGEVVGSGEADGPVLGVGPVVCVGPGLAA